MMRISRTLIIGPQNNKDRHYCAGPCLCNFQKQNIRKYWCPLKMQMDMNSFRNTTKMVLRNCFFNVKPPLVEK